MKDTDKNARERAFLKAFEQYSRPFSSFEEMESREGLQEFFEHVEQLTEEYEKEEAQLPIQPLPETPRKRFILFSRRRTVAVAAVATVLFGTLMSSGAMRERIHTFYMETFKEGSTLMFKTETDAKAPDSIETFYIPDIPETYEIDSEQINKLTYTVTFSDGKELIIFKQECLATQILSDTEDALFEKISVNGYEALYTQKNNMGKIHWRDHFYRYTLAVPLNEFSLVDLKNIAASLIPTQ